MEDPAILQDGGKEKILQKFRLTLNDFKRPYIERLEDYKSSSNDEEPLAESDIQHMGLIKEALKQIDMLYLILEGAIRNGANTRPDLEAKAVCSVFEKNGTFEEIRKNPALKEEFLKYLKLDLKIYPFTLNTKLINSFMRNGVVDHQKDIENMDLE